MSMSQATFFTEFKSVIGIAESDGKHSAAIEMAWKAYSENAKTGAALDFCILGRCSDLSWVLSTVEAAARDPNKEPDIYKDGMLCNFKAGNETQPGQFLNSDNWKIALNDAWVMGGIDAGKTFYLVTNGGFSRKSQIEALLKGSGTNPVTVSGRELIGLHAFGYKPYLEAGVLIFDREHTAKTIDSYKTYLTGIYNFMQKSGKDDYGTCSKTIFDWLTGAGITLS